MLSLLASAFVIALLKLLFAALVVPKFAHLLAKIKYGTDPDKTPECAIAYNKIVGNWALVFEVHCQLACLHIC